jgi:hypothetical protein
MQDHERGREAMEMNNVESYVFAPFALANPDIMQYNRTKNQEPRTKNQEPRTKNQEPRTIVVL